MQGKQTNKPEELKFANYQNLVLAQRLLNESPFAARQLLGIGENEAEFIQNLTPSQINKLAETDLLLFSFRFKENNLDRLKSYIDGDSLALTHLHLQSFVEETEA